AVAHVQVMRPAFGPVFPWMAAGIGADMVQPPLGGRTLLMVLPQAGGIVPAFIAKQRSEAFHPCRALHQPAPVVMPDLMASRPHRWPLSGCAGSVRSGMVRLSRQARHMP